MCHSYCFNRMLNTLFCLLQYTIICNTENNYNIIIITTTILFYLGYYITVKVLNNVFNITGLFYYIFIMHYSVCIYVLYRVYSTQHFINSNVYVWTPFLLFVFIFVFLNTNILQPCTLTCHKGRSSGDKGGLKDAWLTSEARRDMRLSGLQWGEVSLSSCSFLRNSGGSRMSMGKDMHLLTSWNEQNDLLLTFHLWEFTVDLSG